MKFFRSSLFIGLVAIAAFAYADDEKSKIAQNDLITSSELSSEAQNENSFFCKENYVRAQNDRGSYGLYTASDQETNSLGKGLTKNDCVSSASGNFFCKENDVRAQNDRGSYGLYTASDQETNLLGKGLTKNDCVSSVPH